MKFMLFSLLTQFEKTVLSFSIQSLCFLYSGHIRVLKSHTDCQKKKKSLYQRQSDGHMNVRALMSTVSWPHFSYYQRRCGYCQEASTLLVSSLSCDLPSEHCSESSLTCVQTLPRWVERDQTYRVTDRPGLSVLKIKLVNLFFCILFILFYLF